MVYKVTLTRVDYSPKGGMETIGTVFLTDYSRRVKGRLECPGIAAAHKHKHGFDATHFSAQCLEGSLCDYSFDDLCELQALRSLPRAGRWQNHSGGSIY